MGSPADVADYSRVFGVKSGSEVLPSTVRKSPCGDVQKYENMVYFLFQFSSS